jgi:alkanesulfonate monooxygenase SsuD/methylene tetrahydromethanopterin reductase-like flavin-dependent oxidoreductase (luciferase family)
MSEVVFGLDTFGDVPEDDTGRPLSYAAAIRQVVDEAVLAGSMYIGSPETVAAKIARAVKDLGVGRFDLIYSSGSQPASARLRAVELYGTKVIPMVRDILASTEAK